MDFQPDNSILSKCPVPLKPFPQCLVTHVEILTAGTSMQEYAGAGSRKGMTENNDERGEERAEIIEGKRALRSERIQLHN